MQLVGMVATQTQQTLTERTAQPTEAMVDSVALVQMVQALAATEGLVLSFSSILQLTQLL
jgi:hypothetical protein